MNHRDSLSIIHHLLTTSLNAPENIFSFQKWKEDWLETASRWPTPVDRALAGGLAADRPSWAFAAGYQAAIHSLTDRAGAGEIAAVCITERGKPHPSRIGSQLTRDEENQSRWRLTGTKTFVSCADWADTLWIAASIGKDGQGRNRLRMAKVSSGSPGVALESLSPLAILPEIPHGRVRLKEVALGEEDLLPGDGYLAAMKPFRTLEDLHVTAAFLAWLFGVGRRTGWPAGTLEEMTACMVAARSLALQPSLEPHLHIVLGGLLGQVNRLVEEVEPLWPGADPAIRESWQRDRRVLEIAEGTRSKRLQAAWRHY